MAAFDPILSGIPSLDESLDSIRLGDNVVWKVSNLDEFRAFAEPFARQAVKDGRDITYFRFAKHEPVLKNLDGINVERFDPEMGFESFTVAIHESIKRHGRDAFYVFDCLAELQSVWYTDLMMGNFFRVTCPYLFELDTVAYFPMIRGRHSYDVVNVIRETTQLFLDTYSSKDKLYVQAIKVWNRNSESMFLPHQFDLTTRVIKPIRDGVSMAKFYQIRNLEMEKNQDQKMDSYDRFMNMARNAYDNGNFTEEMEDQIIRSSMTRDPHLRKLVKEYFTPEDYFFLQKRMIGSGAIGGKACGMLLARRIAEKQVPHYLEHEEPHDSFYIGSDVFYSYIVYNNDWRLRVHQKREEGYFKEAPALKDHLLHGEFPPGIRAQFQEVIDYFGQSPYILRSSSLLEDGFGNAFAGKYESVFCPNHGSPEERIHEFENAVRTVYASTMDYSALEYRRRRGLNQKDEQMAILVQRVSGSYYGKYFFPGAAGVGYSHSAYRWLADMDPDAGMLRLVMGLGTMAVDRSQTDYPRLSNLDAPLKTNYGSMEQKHKFSQRNVDVIDCEENVWKEVPFDLLMPYLPDWYKKMVMQHDMEVERNLRNRGIYRDVYFVNCEGLLSNVKFTTLMQDLLKTLQKVYQNSVDIEYAVNMNEEGEFVVNLLQCRPLYRSESQTNIDIDRVAFEKTYFDITGSSMGDSCKKKIDIVVRVNPIAYYNYPYAKKYDIAQAVGKINRHYENSGKQLMLMAPGRIGTSSPELGVPVCFGDISNFSVICEVADSRAGYNPELSYGSHMFQDLVEAKISYGAIFENAKTIAYDEKLPEVGREILSEIDPELEKYRDIISVREIDNLWYYLDSIKNHAKCGERENNQ